MLLGKGCPLSGSSDHDRRALRQQLREISAAHQVGRNVPHEERLAGDLQDIRRSVKEELVLDDPPRRVYRDGVDEDLGLLVIEELPRRQSRVVVPICRLPVELVAPRFGHQVHVADAGELRRVVGGYDRDLLGVQDVVQLVYRVVVGVAVLAFLHLGGILARPLRAPHSVRLRYQRRGGNEQARVERSHTAHPGIVEVPRGIDVGLDLGAIGLNNRGSRLHRDFRSHRAHLERHIDPANLAALQDDAVGHEGLEAGSRRREPVGAALQVGNLEVARRGGLHVSLGVGFQIGQADIGAPNHGAGGVHGGASHCREGQLAE